MWKNMCVKRRKIIIRTMVMMMELSQSLHTHTLTHSHIHTHALTKEKDLERKKILGAFFCTRRNKNINFPHTDTHTKHTQARKGIAHL